MSFAVGLRPRQHQFGSSPSIRLAAASGSSFQPAFSNVSSQRSSFSAALSASFCNADKRFCLEILSKVVKRTIKPIKRRVARTPPTVRSNSVSFVPTNRLHHRGCPQPGQDAACADTFFPHEGHGIKFAMPTIMGIAINRCKPTGLDGRRCPLPDGHQRRHASLDEPRPS